MLPAVPTTDSSFLPLAVTVSPGFPGTKGTSERGDHNGLATHLSEPPLMNTHPPCCRVHLGLQRGVQRVAVGRVHSDNTAADALKPTAIEMQLNTQEVCTQRDVNHRAANEGVGGAMCRSISGRVPPQKHSGPLTTELQIPSFTT